MTLWLVFALMTAAAIFAVLWPLARRKPLRPGSDVAVYRDQLDEIQRDRSTGLIGDAEAERGRQYPEHGRQGRGPPSPQSQRRARLGSPGAGLYARRAF